MGGGGWGGTCCWNVPSTNKILQVGAMHYSSSLPIDAAILGMTATPWNPILCFQPSLVLNKILTSQLILDMT